MADYSNDGMMWILRCEVEKVVTVESQPHAATELTTLSSAYQGMSAIVLASVGILVAAGTGGVPRWYQFTFLLGGPLSSYVGGALWGRVRK